MVRGCGRRLAWRTDLGRSHYRYMNADAPPTPRPTLCVCLLGGGGLGVGCLGVVRGSLRGSAGSFGGSDPPTSCRQRDFEKLHFPAIDVQDLSEERAHGVSINYTR